MEAESVVHGEMVGKTAVGAHEMIESQGEEDIPGPYYIHAVVKGDTDDRCCSNLDVSLSLVRVSYRTFGKDPNLLALC